MTGIVEVSVVDVTVDLTVGGDVVVDVAAVLAAGGGGGGGAVDSVDGRTGTVTLSDLYAAAGDARLSDARTPTVHAASHAVGGTDPVTVAAIGAATAAEGALAATAVQPGDLATVATSGAYGDLTGRPATLPPVASYVSRLPPLVAPAAYAISAGSNVVPIVNTRSAFGYPFQPAATSTLTSVLIAVQTGAAGATHCLNLWRCDAAGRPAAHVAAISPIACDTPGNKTVTGLSISLTAGTVYAFASMGGTTAGHKVYGIATGTSGLIGTYGYAAPVGIVKNPLDNNWRLDGYTYSPATAGTPDISPTWTATNAYLEIPNLSFTIEAA